MQLRRSLLLGLMACRFAVAAELDELATVRDRSSHRASSYDHTGGNVDSLMTFAPGATHALVDTDGPGCIRHMWMTLSVFPNHVSVFRDLVLRMYWENSQTPSVEVPLGDFFAMGHGKRYPVLSAPVVVGQHPSALNCYWPMPFGQHARIELFNSGPRTVRRFYYQVDYELGTIPQNQGLFHALFRRDSALRTQAQTGNIDGKDNYVVLDTTGEGQYVGTLLSIDAQEAERWYEGDDMIFIDGAQTPTLHGTGTEDYFCNAWGYKEAFCYPYYGAPLLEHRPDGGIYATFYRWHIVDPIRFKKGIKVTFEHLYDPKLVNDYSSVAFWYQLKPISKREPLPERNYPLARGQAATAPSLDLDTSEVEAVLRERGVDARAIATELHAGYTSGGYLEIHTQGKPVEVPLRVPGPGVYRVEVKPVMNLIKGNIQVGVAPGNLKSIPSAARPTAEHLVKFYDAGTVDAVEGRIVLTVTGNDVIGLDQIRIVRVAAELAPTATRPGHN